MKSLKLVEELVTVYPGWIFGCHVVTVGTRERVGIVAVVRGRL